MAASPVQLPRALGPSSQTQVVAQTALPATSLWLAIVFPRLALDALTSGHRAAPCIAVEQRGGHGRVHTASAAAERLGIRAGMPVNAARALCPELGVYAYDAAAQGAHLTRLALWAGRFTPWVSLAPPRALLLELGGSLRLFGGLDPLCAHIEGELQRMAPDAFHLALTPTPGASLLLAGAGGRPARVLDKAALHSALGPLPIGLLPLDARRLRQLHNIGVRVLRDLWRLPPAELARRFGPSLVEYLERALGRRPDPVPAMVFPERFESSLAFPFDVHEHAVVLTAAEQLLGELIDFLRARDLGTDACVLELRHPGRPPTAVALGLREPTRERTRFAPVLAERINRLALEAPVTGVALRAERFRPYAPAYPALPMQTGKDPAPDIAQDITGLLEQLQARLGRTAVRGVCAVDDHRPERALRLADVAPAPAAPCEQRRPLWLLPEPRTLPRGNGSLRHHGPLQILSGPERIESGWWEGADTRRDYYIATDAAGCRLWVFQDLDSGDWYLHGLFA